MIDEKMRFNSLASTHSFRARRQLRNGGDEHTQPMFRLTAFFAAQPNFMTEIFLRFRVVGLAIICPNAG